VSPRLPGMTSAYSVPDHSMVRRPALPLLALLSLALAGPGAAEAAIGRSVLKSNKIDTGNPAFTVSCPKGTVALNGAPYRTSSAIVPALSAPSGSRKWRFGYASGEDATVRTALRCVRTAARRGSVRYRLGTKRRRAVRLQPDAARRIRLTCPRGLIPSGYGFDESEGSSPQADPGAIDFYEIYPSRRSVRFGLRNDTSEPSQVSVYLRCFSRTARSRRARRRAVVKRRTFRDRLAGDRDKRVRHQCRKGEFALLTGWRLPRNGSVYVDSSYPQRARRGRWLLENLGSRRRVRTVLLCMRERRVGRR
jgi:hypothetical protein